MEKLIIKIMPDYDCFPLWKIGKNIVENISPTELKITESLKELLFNWQKKYDTTLNQLDPITSGFKNQLEEDEFEKEGIVIWKKMISELKNDYDIKYFSGLTGSLYNFPNELYH